MRSTNYWSCSKFADKIRGTVKPYSASGAEWDTWHKNAKKAHPFRYWLVETFLDDLQTILLWPYNTLYDTKVYIQNRFIDKTHALTIHKKNMKRGKYSDLDRRMFYALFDALVDYVEVELANIELSIYDEDFKKLPWWKRTKWSFSENRYPEMGIRKLKYDIESYPDEDQGQKSKNVLDLYIWYTVIRKNRIKADEASGMDIYHADRKARNLKFLEQDPNPNNYHVSGIRQMSSMIEHQYYDEDTQMMVELVKIRGYLWT